MAQIIDPFNASTAVVAKIKLAMERRTGESMTAAEAKAELREMVRRQTKASIRTLLDQAYQSEAPDHSDVELTD